MHLASRYATLLDLHVARLRESFVVSSRPPRLPSRATSTPHNTDVNRGKRRARARKTMRLFMIALSQILRQTCSPRQLIGRPYRRMVSRRGLVRMSTARIALSFSHLMGI